MNFIDEWLELLVVLIFVAALIVMGSVVYSQYLDKARLTLSVAAMNKAQVILKSYKSSHHSFPTNLDFSNCSNQDHRVVLNCDEVKADINSFVSYTGTAETFVLKAKAKDSRGTAITVTESAIAY